MHRTRKSTGHQARASRGKARRAPVLKLRERGFTLIELLTVMAIMAILAVIATPLIPSLLKANQLDSSVMVLSGLLEQARESAISDNTYIWVAFTDAPAHSSTGTWVATIQSKDGTETGINTAVIPAWTSTITVPSANYSNLQLLTKLQNLPGIKIVDATSTNLPASLLNEAPTSPSTLFENGAQLASGATQGPVTWTVTALQNSGASATVYFTHALEFTPTGEAHVPTTWNSNIQFGFIPTSGTGNNAVLFNVTRLTGKTTLYRQ